jgi:hypothetical protein
MFVHVHIMEIRIKRTMLTQTNNAFAHHVSALTLALTCNLRVTSLDRFVTELGLVILMNESDKYYLFALAFLILLSCIISIRVSLNMPLFL